MGGFRDQDSGWWIGDWIVWWIEKLERRLWISDCVGRLIGNEAVLVTKHFGSLVSC